MNRRSAFWLICGLALVFLTQPAFACPQKPTPTAYTISGPRYVLAMETDPTPIQVGTAFSVRLHICDHQARPFTGSLKADATMPLHKHGMNYRPSVSAQGNGSYRLDGFVFHMPGLWRFSFELQTPGGTERLLLEYPLGP